MYSLITFPSATSVLETASTWTNPLFDEFWIVAGVGVGIFVFSVVVVWLFRTITNSVSHGLSGTHHRSPPRSIQSHESSSAYEAWLKREHARGYMKGRHDY